MEIISGSCRLGLWFVHVFWVGTTVHRVWFAARGIPGEVPMPVKKYCAGHNVDLTVFDSVAIHGTPLYNRIYQEVRAVPYGSTATYSEIAARSGTIPRVVGQAMARNITPLVIPCHRIVGTHGIGGFSPSVEIKEMLLAMEQKTMRKKKP